MGLLSEGSPLSWEKTKELADHVRRQGVLQFINMYHRLKDKHGDVLKWGDEVEYMIVKFDDDNKKASLSLRGQELLSILNEKEAKNPDSVKSVWRPEYGAYMVEGTPGKPYGCLLAHFNIVEANMRYRREEAQQLLKEDERLITVTSYPRLGCGVFTNPVHMPNPNEGSSRSLFIPDEVIYPGHPRFKTLTRNIRMRRGEKVAINLPVYRDDKTMTPFKDDLNALGDNGESAKAALPDHVYMDAMAFGMGCCCLQLTFQACNIDEARTLYDQLTPLCPILLALTAASPIHRGVLTDVDCRWSVISSSVDCRTREERGLEPLKNNRFVIPKSRYDSIDSYLSPQGEVYNDVPIVHDEEIYEALRKANIDHLLAQHIAHLFIRDTVSLFSEKVHQAATDTDHFENIQSTNWQTMRFKVPPPNSNIGWRVEFRPCEVQLTDFENAAFVIFVVLLTRVILSYKLNLLIPISKVDENMTKAQKRSAVREEVFWFRKDITSNGHQTNTNTDINDQYCAMTINQIINGKEGVFPGLIPLINSYLNGMEVDTDTHCSIQQYLKLIQRRASGQLLTTASWIRQFVRQHPSYKQDSIVNEQVNYDLLKTIDGIQAGTVPCPELIGQSLVSKTKESIPLAMEKESRKFFSQKVVV
ncbi:glutamate--cysteine ligase catalytic subunit [Cimex lectularius]|uniref:Glutamate--cysteine ligase n=1 Tax=Cimex lectularius TaxID=79782 RepID=A0A8I6TL51_CIMLE|nr:glutamate--cysteine ligase catalytic subunit [Cimex lectularius]